MLFRSFDEALALPTEESAKLALRTQQVLATESGVTRTADPLGGSYYVEALTNEVEQRAREYIDKIDELGGAARAVEFMQDEIHRTAYQFQRNVEAGTRPVVGVNIHADDEKLPKLDRPDFSALESAQIDRLRATRSARDAADASSALQAVTGAAKGTDNLMPHLIRAVKAGVTLGEISDALRAEWGTYDG